MCRQSGVVGLRIPTPLHSFLIPNLSLVELFTGAGVNICYPNKNEMLHCNFSRLILHCVFLLLLSSLLLLFYCKYTTNIIHDQCPRILDQFLTFPSGSLANNDVGTVIQLFGL